MTDEASQESWAIVELMGHVTMAGRLSEEERFGSKMGRLDIPDDNGGFATVYFGGSSVYRISAVSEAAARIKAHTNQPRPVSAWEIPTPEEPRMALDAPSMSPFDPPSYPPFYHEDDEREDES